MNQINLKYYLLILLIFGLKLSHSQTEGKQITISGYIVDSKDETGLPGATITSSNTKGTITNNEGFFELSHIFGKDSILLFINFIGIVVHHSTSNIDLGIIGLEQNNVLLEEVEIKAKIPIAVQFGDTIAFNAKAVQVNEEAKGVDILKKLPGFKIKENKVETQGEQVKKVYLDGKPFFEADPKNALNAIPAELVQQIELFDDYGEVASFTGYASGNSVKAINIITNPDRNKKLIGDINIGLGTQEHYSIEATAFYKKNKHDLSVIIDHNNINKSRSDFSTFQSFEDLIASKLGINLSPGSIRPGEEQIQNLSLNYNYNNKGNILTFDYNYGVLKRDLKQEIKQNYQDKLYYDIQENNHSVSNLHNTRLKYNLTSGKSKWIFNSQFNFKESSYSIDSNSGGQVDSIPYLNSANVNTGDKNQYNWNTSAIWLHNLNDMGRSVTAIANLKINKLAEDKDLDIENIYFSSNDTLNLQREISYEQDETLKQDENKALIRISYKEPLSLLSSLNLVYTSSYKWSQYDQEIISNNEFKAIQPKYDFFSNKVELGYSSFGLKLIWNFGLGVEFGQMNKSDFGSFLPNNQTENYTFLYPMVFGKYFISSKENITFFARGSTITPSIYQLMPGVDLDDPLKVFIGNPDLQPGSQYTAMLKYVLTNSEKARYLSAYAYGQYNLQFIGMTNWITTEDSTYFSTNIPAATNMFQAQNLGEQMNIVIGTDYSFPLNRIRSVYNTGLKYTFTRFPSKLNNKDFLALNHAIELNNSVSSDISPKVDFFVSNLTSFNYSHNSENNNYTKFVNNSLEVDLYLKFMKSFIFEFELQHYNYYYFNDHDNQSYSLVNLSLGKSFLAGKLYFKISVYDLLDQNKNIAFNIYETHSESVISNNLQQYVMLSAKWKF